MKQKRGFTLVELVVVVMIISTMFVLTTQSLFSGSRSASLDQLSTGLIRDVREQQIRAMQGSVVTLGSVVDYSIRFEQDRYILYPGMVYDSGNVQNQVVLLGPTMQFSVIGVPDQTITFARGSGEVRGFSSGSDTVVLTDTGLGDAVDIRINAAGVVFINRQ
ncbi:MAG: type II secretion system protein [Patescibacteria group bacterium]